jgi:hypothetical protein
MKCGNPVHENASRNRAPTNEFDQELNEESLYVVVQR